MLSDEQVKRIHDALRDASEAVENAREHHPEQAGVQVRGSLPKVSKHFGEIAYEFRESRVDDLARKIHEKGSDPSS